MEERNDTRSVVSVVVKGVCGREPDLRGKSRKLIVPGRIRGPGPFTRGEDISKRLRRFLLGTGTEGIGTHLVTVSRERTRKRS